MKRICLSIILYAFFFSNCSHDKKQIASNVHRIISDTLANAIIQKTERNYASLHNYFDSGKTIVSFYNNNHPFKKALLFKTSYSNTGLFNFEYYEVGNSNSLYVINKNSENIVQSWWGITNQLKTHSSLESPLAASTGVSSSTSILIPKLLLRTKILGKANIFHNMQNPILTSTETVNGFVCYKISEADTMNKILSVWIDKEKLLIRKVETDNVVKDFRVRTTYQFFPFIPEKVDKELFTFKPYREVSL